MESPPLFRDRTDAGQQLAAKSMHYAGQPDLLVLGLPRGGVPVAFEVARALEAPLDIFLVRKLGVPGQEELAMGALASGGVRVLNQKVIAELHIPDNVLAAATKAEQQELVRREQTYRGERPAPTLQNKTVILVDDGLATGASMRAAVLAIQVQKPARIVVAVPTAAHQTGQEFKGLADEIICVETPKPFWGVGWWYENFSPTSDQEVCLLLKRKLLLDHRVLAH
ncbi:MAG: phosphoribosyltransferase [Chloroflexi bacterium]|nr:phosphoribosyltransferase [Chloroflexota bacterium]